MAERLESPFGSRRKRSDSSPPSPVFDLPPMRFMAIASVSCASREIEPKLMAPVEKRLTISAADSTSSIGTGRRPSSSAFLMRKRPRMAKFRCTWPFKRLAYCAVGLDALAANGVLEERDRLRRPHVVLAADAVGVFAADIERQAQHRDLR